MRRTALALLAAAAIATAGCSSDDAGDDSAVTVTDTADTGTDTGSDVDAGSEVEPSESEPANDADGSTTATDPVSVKPEPARTAGDVDAPAGVEPDGFTTATVRVTSADGEVCDVCLWLADAGDERGRGLMGVTDLGEPVGMLFRFEQPTSGNFFMFNTPMPLSIAWFADDGTQVFETDMEPCLVDDSSICERYGPGAEYLFAVEMVQGELDVIGIGPGSTIELLGEHDSCPAAG